MNNEHSPELDAYLFRAHKTRGEILDHTILLERIMDEFISLAFSDKKEKMREIMDLIVSEGLNYNNKVKLVLKIIRRKIPEEKDRVKRMPKFEVNLKSVASTRNQFAHELMLIDFPNELLNKYYIVLHNFAKDKTVAYFENDVIEAINFIHEQINILNELRKEFWAQ